MLTITPAKPGDFPRLVAIWESSVRATHHFLRESDIEKLRPLLRDVYLPNLNVVTAQDENGEIRGFLGTDGNRIEMLFVDAAMRGQGTGKFLLNYAVEQLQADELDVNEQNPQGAGFYRHMGFTQTGRSELDGEGNPFPLLHMKYTGKTAG